MKTNNLSKINSNSIYKHVTLSLDPHVTQNGCTDKEKVIFSLIANI
jgi:hypothetical protein